MSRSRYFAVAFVLLGLSNASSFAQKLPADDLTPNFKAPAGETDYDKRVEMVPMRDGTKP